MVMGRNRYLLYRSKDVKNHKIIEDIYMRKGLVLSALLFSSATFAASGDSYVGGGYHMGNYDEDGLSTASPSALKLEYGYYITDQIAIEGNFAFGIAEDTIDVLGSDVDIEVEQAISLFVKGDLNLSSSVNLYGLLGYTKGKLKATIPDLDETLTENDSGLSYGAGLEGITAGGFIFSAEYIMYLSEDEYDYSGFNLGIAKKF
jgi:Outer membrane protein beta-barrel domain